MLRNRTGLRASRWTAWLALGAAVALAAPAQGEAQDRGNPEGEWRFWGGDAWSTRSSSLDQINAENFGDLEVAWVWRGDNFGPTVDNVARSMPIYADGRLFTVAGHRRTVASIDPATGETLWIYREPPTQRWERSPRQNYGKGVAYAEVDGRGVIYMVSPAFFLHAVDAETGRPLEGFGAPVPLEGFAETGTVDMLADLGYPYDVDYGIPDDIGYITNSSPPIVVDGVVIVPNSHHQGYRQTINSNVRGDVLAYDARTGEHLWTFEVVPQGEAYGAETWEDASWEYTGNSGPWAPLSADPELGLVYLPNSAPTNDFYGGHRLGDNLFANALVALDVRTGELAWYQQLVRHDLWNYDNPTAPNLVDVVVDGEPIPAIIQTTKQGIAYAFNRATGEPIWEMQEVEVPESRVPGERTAPTQPIPVRPAPYERQSLEDNIVDFTPELHQAALELLEAYDVGPLFNPPLHQGNEEGLRAAIHCPGSNGGTNIPGGAAVDPETGILYVASINSCSAPQLIPGTTVNPDSDTRYLATSPGFVPGVRGVPLVKPPYGRITAIDMNTGEHLWWIPNGDTPEGIRNNPALEGVDLPRTGRPAHATPLVTGSLFIHAEGRGGGPYLHAVDKLTGESVGTVELPASGQYAIMTYMHEGRQYIAVPIAGSGMPASLAALRLP